MTPRLQPDDDTDCNYGGNCQQRALSEERDRLRAGLRLAKKRAAALGAEVHKRAGGAKRNAALDKENAALRMALRETRHALVQALATLDVFRGTPSLDEHGPHEVHQPLLDSPYTLCWRYPVLTRIAVVLGEEPR